MEEKTSKREKAALEATRRRLMELEDRKRADREHKLRVLELQNKNPQSRGCTLHSSSGYDERCPGGRDRKCTEEYLTTFERIC